MNDKVYIAMSWGAVNQILAASFVSFAQEVVGTAKSATLSSFDISSLPVTAVMTYSYVDSSSVGQAYTVTILLGYKEYGPGGYPGLQDFGSNPIQAIQSPGFQNRIVLDNNSPGMAGQVEADLWPLWQSACINPASAMGERARQWILAR